VDLRFCFGTPNTLRTPPLEEKLLLSMAMMRGAGVGKRQHCFLLESVVSRIQLGPEFCVDWGCF